MHPLEECTGLASSELRAVILQKRTLMFFCKDCRHAFKSAPALMRQIEALKSEVIALKQEIEDIKMKIEERKIPEMENLMMEVQERTNRSLNFMIYNAKEHESSELKTRIEEDKKVVSKVIELMGIEETTGKILKVIRVGKKSPNKNRPLKVICLTNDFVNLVIKFRHKLYSTELRVSRDQTKLQQNHWKSLRNELKSREDKGENNLIIKYIRGMPQIVPRNTQKNHS